MKKIQINQTSIGQQDYNLVEKVGEDINVFSPSLYKAIDLGLPSGTLWADRNIGAATPEDSGLYFQWGDTQGYTAEQVGDGEGQKSFDWTSYKFLIEGGSYKNPSDYLKYSRADGKMVLDPEDDAAHVIMGGNWRMPTSDDFVELCQNTDLYLVPTEGEEIKGNISEEIDMPVFVQWESFPSNIKGIKFYRKGDKGTYLFVPATGYFNANNALIDDTGLHTSSRYYISGSNIVYCAWCFQISRWNLQVLNLDRTYGIQVRGIIRKPI